MPLRWIAKPASAPSLVASPTAEPPKIVLVAPGSITPSSFTTRKRLSHALAAGSLLAVALRPLPSPQAPRALATLFTVTNTGASGPGSLFQAVHDANANTGPDTINFSPSVVGTIALTATLKVTDSVTILGPGPGLLSVSGAGIGGSSGRVFYLYNNSSSPLTATISGLTIRDAALSKGSGAGISASNFGLILDGVDLISNTTGTKAGGGGLEFSTNTAITASLTIRNSLVSGNHAGGAGGGLGISLYQGTPGRVVITNTQLVSNTAVGSGGGAFLDNPSSLLMKDSSIMSNTAGSDGGGLDFRPTTSSAVSLTIQNSLVSGNYAGATGGGLGIFLYISSASDLVITNTQIVSNTAVKSGGGANLSNVKQLLIEDSTIMSNKAMTTTANGGGLRVTLYSHAGTETIRRTTISGNMASGAGGGIYLYKSSNLLIEDSTIAGNTAGKNGGGIKANRLYGKSNTIRRTTISGNTAVKGGGVYLTGLYSPVSIENSTLSGNHATGHGGGVYLYNRGLASIQNSTIFSNTAASGGGVEVRKNFLPITDTIIAGNVAPLGPDISGTFKLRYDLVQITGTAAITNAGGNLFGLDPLLGPLANNGGPTQTHFPNLASPVVNMGDPAFAPPPANDQRGRLRVVGGQIDIGAVEVSPSAAQLSSSSYQVNENGLTATVTVTRTGGSDGIASVDYATGGGTAIAGTDYQMATGTLHWADGDAAPKTFTVQIIDDNLLDGTATVGLQLSNPQGGVQLGSPITGTLTIVDNLFTIDLPLIRR